MIYQLSNGKCIEISVEYFLEMTDEDEQDLVAMDTGFSVSNPFDLKIVNNKVSKNKANTHVEIEEEEDNEKIQLLQDINDGDKLTDPDFFPLEKNKFD